jgi:hypothetical protein
MNRGQMVRPSQLIFECRPSKIIKKLPKRMGDLLDILYIAFFSPYLVLLYIFKLIGKDVQVSVSGDTSVSSAPGHHLLKIVEFLCTKKVYERVFLQAVLDMREEHNEALFAGQKRKAQWVLIRGYLALTWSVTLKVVEFLLSGPVKIIKTLWS